MMSHIVANCQWGRQQGNNACRKGNNKILHTDPHSFANDMKAVSETLRGRTGGDFVGLAKMADCDVGDGGLCWATRWRVLMG